VSLQAYDEKHFKLKQLFNTDFKLWLPRVLITVYKEWYQVVKQLYLLAI